MYTTLTIHLPASPESVISITDRDPNEVINIIPQIDLTEYIERLRPVVADGRVKLQGYGDEGIALAVSSERSEILVVKFYLGTEQDEQILAALGTLSDVGLTLPDEALTPRPQATSVVNHNFASEQAIAHSIGAKMYPKKVAEVFEVIMLEGKPVGNVFQFMHGQIIDCYECNELHPEIVPVVKSMSIALGAEGVIVDPFDRHIVLLDSGDPERPAVGLIDLSLHMKFRELKAA
jgi:hypothetical protein